MVSRRTPAAPSTYLPQLGGSDGLTVIAGRGLRESFIPDVPALTELSTTIRSLAQEIMMVTYQRPEGTMLVGISDLLVAAGSQLATIERLSAGDRRVRMGLDGARTALLTAVRELREHLVRHGWVVDDIAQWAHGDAGTGSSTSA